MTDNTFESLLKKSLIMAAELDYMSDIPPDNEIDLLISPSKRFQQQMSKLIDNPRSYIKKLQMPLYLKTLRTAAAVLLVISILLGISMLNPDVRAEVLKFIRTWFNNRTEYGIVDGANAKVPTSVALGYMPEGFDLVFEAYDPFGVNLVYQSGNHDYFDIAITGEAERPHVDNEHSEFYNMIISDCIVDVYESNDLNYPSILICYNESYNIMIIITGTIIVDELINILSNISF